MDDRIIEVNASLTLKAVSPADAPRLHAAIIREKERLSKSLHWPRFIDRLEDTVKFCEASAKSFGSTNAIYVAEFNGELAGVVSFNGFDFSNGIGEIGYWLTSGHERKGIAFLSVQALVETYADQRKIRRFVIKCAERNHPSRAVAERLGFRFEGTLVQAEKIGDAYLDQRIYARIAAA